MGPARRHRRRAEGNSDRAVSGEFDAAAERAVQGWPPLSPERRAELARVLGAVNARPPASAAEQPGEEVRSGNSAGSTDAEVKEWARREAAKAPPFRPEQRDLIISAFANALREIPDRDDESGGVTGE